jgi:MFS family permease
MHSGDGKTGTAMGATGTRKIAAAIIGNSLEWYDFTIYGYMAVTIAKLFFPAAAGWAPLLSTLGIFGIAYVARPLGGILLGHCADLYGRKFVFTVVLALMLFGTTMVAITPTYATIGIAAPIIILCGRLLQGVSAGGEFGSAATFLVEIAPANRRGFYGAWQFSGQGIAVFLSGIIGGGTAHLLSPDSLESWGWRIPFFIGLLIGPIGLYMRARLTETPDFIASRRAAIRDERPIASIFAHYKHRTLLGFGLVVGGTAMFYVLFVFMPTYAMRVLGLDPAASFISPIVSGLTVAIGAPLMGLVSDHCGRKLVMGCAAATGIVLMYPAFAWLAFSPSMAVLATVEIFFGLLFSAYVGPFSAAIASMFPVGVRATGLSVAYNIGVSIFGGFSPLIVAWLIAATGDPLAPCYYVIGCLVISAVAIAAMPRQAPPERQGR